jgi:phospholipid:diacylglycerol acyltransferase
MALIKQEKGVYMGEGDGTVSLLYCSNIPLSLTSYRSSGYMCVKGWKIDRFNPARIPVITREMDHEPEFLDLRGGPRTAGFLIHVQLLMQIMWTFWVVPNLM